MSFKKTIIIALLFILVAAYYVWDQKRIKTVEGIKEAESRLVTPKKDTLNEITIKTGDRTTRLVKQGEAWKITQPIEARTDESAVNSLIDEIDRAIKTSPFETKDDLAGYGLKDPSIKAEIKAEGKNYVQNLELGNETPAKDEVYAKAARDGKIFTVPVGLKTQLGKPLNELRDKRTLPANLNQASSVTLAFDGKTFELEKKGNDWQMDKPRKGPADSAKISNLLRDWNETKAVDFIDTKPLDLAAFGLDKPALTALVSVTEKDKPTSLTLLVGKPAADAGKTESTMTNRYAMQKGGNYVFTVGDEALNKLKPTLDDLRSKQLFTVNSADAGRVIFNVHNQTVDLERDSAGKWRLRGEKDVKLDRSLVNSKISDLTALKATKFIDTVTSPAATGLDSPNLRLTVVSKDGKTTQSLITGKKAQDGDYVYARQLEGGETVAVDWQEPGKFFLTRDDLLDKSMFNFDAGLACKVEITDDGKKMTFTKEKSGGWTGVPEGSEKTYQVEGAQMSALVYSLSGLAWARRLNPIHPTDQKLVKDESLEKPARAIVVYGEGDKELARLGQGGEKDPYQYVRAGQKDYFAVNKTQYSVIKIAVDAVIKAATEKK